MNRSIYSLLYCPRREMTLLVPVGLNKKELR
jgi:hypothetical protein